MLFEIPDLIIMDLSNGKVAIVITSYNRPTQIVRAINSAINQTYRNIEIIVVDGGSDFPAEEVVNNFKDERIKFIQAGKNSNVSLARNLGSRETDAPYISFLDDDDELLPNKIERQIHAFIHSPEDVGVVYCGKIVRINNLIKKCKRPAIKGDVLEKLLGNNFVPLGGALIKKEYFLKTDGFVLSKVEDWDLWIELAKKCKFDFVDECLLIYDIHPNQLSNRSPDIISGYECIYNKNKELYEKKPKSLAGLYFYFGYQYLRAGDNNRSKDYFKKSIQLYHRQYKCIYYYIISMLPDKLIRILLHN